MDRGTEPSISFRLEGDVSVIVSVTETADGGLHFALDVDESAGQTADINGLFFDFAQVSLVDALLVDGAEVTKTVFAHDDVDNLGGGVNIKGDLVNDTDLFDAGVRFGTSGIAKDDIQSTGFILTHETETLSLSDVAGMDFGVRLTSVGDIDGSREGSVKLGGTAPDEDGYRPGPGENEGSGSDPSDEDETGDDEFDFDTGGDGGDGPVDPPPDGPNDGGVGLPLDAAALPEDGIYPPPPDGTGSRMDDGFDQPVDEFLFL